MKLWMTVCLMKGVQIMIDTGVLLGVYFFIQIGIVLLYNTDPAVTFAKACAEAKAIPEVLMAAPHVLFFFSFLMFVTASMGITGNLLSKESVLHVCSLLVYLLASIEILFFTTVYIHGDLLQVELRVCLTPWVQNRYEGPWVQDPTSFSYALDKYQYENQCCGVENFQTFDDAKHWDKKTWDYPNDTIKDHRIPWTCCNFNGTDVKEQYDPNITFDSLKSSIFSMDCPYILKSGSFHNIGCREKWQSGINDGKTKFLLTGFVVIVAQLASCYMSAYGAKSIKYMKRESARASKKIKSS